MRKIFSPIYFRQHIQAMKVSLRQLSHSPFSAFMTFMVIGVAFALPMGLYILLENVQTVVVGLQSTTQITVYIKQNTSERRVDEVTRVLKNDLDIDHVRYISPEEGLAAFQQAFHVENILESLKENPLPGVFVIRPAYRIQTTLQVNQLIDRLKRLPVVEDIRLDRVWLERLNAMITLGSRIIHVLLLFFSFAIVVVVGNTIRLMVETYRHEITVIKLLGGEDAFVRRPFLYSGIIYGVMGSIISWLLVDSMVWSLQKPLQRLIDLYNSTFVLEGLGLQSTISLLIGGFLLGYLGSWLAVGRYIKMVEPE